MTPHLPASIDDTAALLVAHDYIPDRQLATALFLALRLQRPLFLEGEPGTGKTEIAKTVAAMLERPLIRLQCHEGLDLSGAAYEWNYARQMIEIRLAESARRLAVPDPAASDIEAEREPDDVRERLAGDLFSPRFLIRRALLQAIDPAQPRAAGAADRRARSRRRALRGLPARGAVRLPDHHPGARHDQGDWRRRSSSSPRTARARSTTR